MRSGIAYLWVLVVVLFDVGMIFQPDVSTDGVMMHSPFLVSKMVTFPDSPMSSKLSEDSTGLKSDE